MNRSDCMYVCMYYKVICYILTFITLWTQKFEICIHLFKISTQKLEFCLNSMHLCMLSGFSRVWLFATLWTVCSPPGGSAHGILQARTLEWVAMPSSRGSSWLRDWTRFSSVFRTGRQVLCHYCHHLEAIHHKLFLFGLFSITKCKNYS